MLRGVYKSPQHKSGCLKSEFVTHTHAVPHTCSLFMVGFFFFFPLWAETVNSVMRRSVRGLGLNARRASDSVHSLLYIDGAANLCQSQSESHAAARLK